MTGITCNRRRTDAGFFLHINTDLQLFLVLFIHLTLGWHGYSRGELNVVDGKVSLISSEVSSSLDVIPDPSTSRLT